MLAWQDWTFPTADILYPDWRAEMSVLFADWWGFSLTHLWWATEGCPDCAAGVERC